MTKLAKAPQLPHPVPVLTRIAMPRLALALILSAFVFTGCSKKETVSASDSASASETVHPMRGIVREIRLAEDTVVIEHEDVPGYMPAMTMPFNIRDAGEFGKIHPGSAIAFELVTTTDASWIRGIRDIPEDSLKLPAPRPAPVSTTSTRVREGDAMPDFHLTDQQGRKIDKAAFAGKNLILTFIFTRCPIPDFCPRMSANFSELEKSISANPALKSDVRLLSVSIDPEFDTPAVLTEYATKYDAADSGVWSFATGSASETAALTKAFAVYTEQAGGTIEHGLCTAWIGPDGVVREIWRGNFWTPAEIMGALKSQTPKH
jgi:protein SCO1/2